MAPLQVDPPATSISTTRWGAADTRCGYPPKCRGYTLRIPAQVSRIHVADTRPSVADTRCGYPPKCRGYTLRIPAQVSRIHVADTRPSVADTRCGYPPKCRGYTLRIPAQVSRIHVADTRPSVADTRCGYPPKCRGYTLRIPAQVSLPVPHPGIVQRCAQPGTGAAPAVLSRSRFMSSKIAVSCSILSWNSVRPRGGRSERAAHPSTSPRGIGSRR